LAADAAGRLHRRAGPLLDSPRDPQYLRAAAWHSRLMSANGLENRKFPLSPGTRGSADEEAMAKTKFRPLHDRVVVRRIEAEEKTKGGIIIPDTAKEKPQEGEIVAVGPGGRDEAGKLVPMDVKAGDRVLFGKWSGTEVKIDGEELLIMKESDIMGVVA
jgi:chaperonin GroES